MARAKKKAVESSIKSKASITDFDVIIRPIITEKTMDLMQNQNKVTIEVPKTANKTQIKLAFQKVFGVAVTGVNIINVARTNTSRGGRYKGYIPGYKKAVVQVKEGEALDLFKE